MREHTSILRLGFKRCQLDCKTKCWEGLILNHALLGLNAIQVQIDFVKLNSKEFERGPTWAVKFPFNIWRRLHNQISAFKQFLVIQHGALIVEQHRLYNSKSSFKLRIIS